MLNFDRDIPVIRVPADVQKVRWRAPVQFDDIHPAVLKNREIRGVGQKCKDMIFTRFVGVTSWSNRWDFEDHHSLEIDLGSSTPIIGKLVGSHEFDSSTAAVAIASPAPLTATNLIFRKVQNCMNLTTAGTGSVQKRCVRSIRHYKLGQISSRYVERVKGQQKIT